MNTSTAVIITPADVVKMESDLGVNCRGIDGDLGQHDCVLQFLIDSNNDRYSGREIERALDFASLVYAERGDYNSYDLVVEAVRFLTV